MNNHRSKSLDDTQEIEVDRRVYQEPNDGITLHRRFTDKSGLYELDASWFIAHEHKSILEQRRGKVVRNVPMLAYETEKAGIFSFEPRPRLGNLRVLNMLNPPIYGDGRLRPNRLWFRLLRGTVQPGRLYSFSFRIYDIPPFRVPERPGKVGYWITLNHPDILGVLLRVRRDDEDGYLADFYCKIQPLDS